MINELQLLSEAINAARVSTSSGYREYVPIPNIKKDAPCFRIVLEGERVPLIESVAPKNGSIIRKFGNNQGSFPAMNLTPLYNIPEEENGLRELIRKTISDNATDLDSVQVKSWCVVNNWDEKFSKKYRISMVERPKRMKEMLQGVTAFEPALHLIEAAQLFAEPEKLHHALTEACLQMLEDHRETALALRMLFYTGSGNGNLSVVLDTFYLEDTGYTTIGSRFTNGLNDALLEADRNAKAASGASMTDAFSLPFSPLEEPMPSVKLPAGFSVTLRTMFKGQPCQQRYKRIENASYPISPDKRYELKAALEWLSAPEREKITWISTGKDEALFVYPSRLCDPSVSFTSIYKQQERDGKETLFVAESKRFVQHIEKLILHDPEYCPDRIQLFFLRKLDKARTKVVYTHNTSPQEIISICDSWVKASKNLPAFHFGQPDTPFPMQITPILNRAWKQDGSLASTGFRAVRNYHGLELFFDPEKPKVAHDLQILVRGCEGLAIYVGQCFGVHTLMMPQKALRQLKESLALMGMLLYWTGSGKDTYMNDDPYLLGQLLKVSDSLHELYCAVVRTKIPPQLVGGSMYVAASEFPERALAQLGQRMMPYLSWAKTNRNVRLPKGEGDSGKEGPTAGYYLYLYALIADKLNAVFTPEKRFSDAEKAQLFIGYLASFPKKEEIDNTINE